MQINNENIVVGDYILYYDNEEKLCAIGIIEKIENNRAKIRWYHLKNHAIDYDGQSFVKQNAYWYSQSGLDDLPDVDQKLIVKKNLVADEENVTVKLKINKTLFRVCGQWVF
jgi:hypothetical protein